MRIWDIINSATQSVKQQVADPAPIVETCKTSYDYCSGAAGKIGNVVRVNGQRVHEYVSDEETRAQIGLVSTKLLQSAARYAQEEAYKSIPGGTAAAEIIRDTINDVKLEKQNKQEMEARKSSSSLIKANKSPIDVLNDFMMNEFIGNRFADGLVFPQIKIHANKI